MPTPTINEYLKFANLQMAAEAFLVREDGTVRDDIAAALIAGNKHAFRFTETQADAFANQWKVLDHRTPPPRPDSAARGSGSTKNAAFSKAKSRPDDSYFGGASSGSKTGRGSENKAPFVAAASLSDEGHPLRIKLSPVPGFTLRAIAAWASTNLPMGSTVSSDCPACVSGVTEAGCVHQPTIIAGRKPKDLPEFQWVNTVLGNLKTSLSGCYHAFDFQRYAARCGTHPEGTIRMTKVRCYQDGQYPILFAHKAVQ